MGEVWHIGRGWTGPDSDLFQCPCPKTPCGLTVMGEWDPTCTFHGWDKSLRQGHVARDCPALRGEA
jgi:hypothetical protein